MASYRQLNRAQYQRALEQARQRHDDKFAVDYPRPELRRLQSQETGIEKAVNYLWLIWLIIGLAGAAISLPHTVSAITSTVSLQGALAIGYALAGFIGVELGLIGVAVVSALKEQELEELEGRRARKQSSLAGLLNGLATRLGFRPPFNLEHLPEQGAPTGAFLVGLLFLASLTFNLADALKGVELLQPLEPEIHLLAKLTAGLLGPGLLLISGHRFAHEMVRSGSKRKRYEIRHERALQEWEAMLQNSWQENSERFIQEALAIRWQALNAGAGREANPYLRSGSDFFTALEPEPSPVRSQ